MLPVFAEFATAVPRTGNAAVRSERARFARDHVALGGGGTVTIEFQVPEEGVTDELTVKVRALVSKLGRHPGHAPLEISVNGKAVVTGFRIPGGGDIPQQLTFAVPADLLVPGAENTLTVGSAADARTQLWLYRVLVEPVWDRDAAERAWLADSFASSLLTYRTDRRAPGAAEWEPAGDWRLHVDGGEGALPSRLDWRAGTGAEASVCFALELHTFYGHTRDADGRWYELRGTLTDRQAFPGDADPAATLAFTTQAGWGGRWHEGGPLTLHLVTGDGPYDRIAWTDQRACSASVGLAPDGGSFQGWSQRVNEGPVGYRGAAVVAEPEPERPKDADHAGPPTFAADLDDLAQAITKVADTAVRSLGSLFRRP